MVFAHMGLFLSWCKSSVLHWSQCLFTLAEDLSHGTENPSLCFFRAPVGHLSFFWDVTSRIEINTCIKEAFAVLRTALGIHFSGCLYIAVGGVNAAWVGIPELVLIQLVWVPVIAKLRQHRLERGRATQGRTQPGCSQGPSQAAASLPLKPPRAS